MSIVLKSQNYGSLGRSSTIDNIDTSAFGASPPSRPVDIQHNEHLSNIPNFHRSMSHPLVPQASPSKIKGIYNAAIHSPYWRTISPHITAKSRSRRTSSVGTDGYRTPQSLTPHGRYSPFFGPPGKQGMKY